MDKTSFDKISQKLKDSPLYNLSMANKELFHSNFLAWFGNKYKREFKEIISNLLGHGSWPNEIKDDFKIVREYNHFDICIKNLSDPSRIIIENKVKTIPNKKQLDKYKKEVNNDSCLFILLTMTKVTEVEGWNVIKYNELINEMKKVIIHDCYHSQLLKDYCIYISNLQDAINKYTAEFCFLSEDEQQQSELGIKDICGKIKVQKLYEILLKKCTDNKIKFINDYDLFINYERLTDDAIGIGWQYTNNPLIEIDLKSKNDDIIVIQIQGNQYRHGIRFFDKKLGNRINKKPDENKGYYPSDKGYDYLNTNYSDILSLNNDKDPKHFPFDNRSFGQRNEYCKYCKKTEDGKIGCFVYQWIKIPDDITFDKLAEVIIKDILDIKNLKK